MIDHTTIPQFRLLVYGDWSTVISAFCDTMVREALLNQKPNSEDDAEYGEYSLRFADCAELFSLMTLAYDKRLYVEVLVEIESKSTGVSVVATTGDGWGSKAKLSCAVRVDPSKINSDATYALRQIRELAGKF